MFSFSERWEAVISKVRKYFRLVCTLRFVLGDGAKNDGTPYTCKHKQQSQILITKKHETKQEQVIQLLETQT